MPDKHSDYMDRWSELNQAIIGMDTTRARLTQKALVEFLDPEFPEGHQEKILAAVTKVRDGVEVLVKEALEEIE